MINEETKKEIDEMDYEGMLSLWRFAQAGHPMFAGEVGDYFSKVFREKGQKLRPGEHAIISKRIGW